MVIVAKSTIFPAPSSAAGSKLLTCDTMWPFLSTTGSPLMRIDCILARVLRIGSSPLAVMTCDFFREAWTPHESFTWASKIDPSSAWCCGDGGWG